ncbi:hypothetical protein JW921_05245, partial [Candidatus Fermentibacterales bacterium]|nr:hypothetical protein [Candidatus Fermentibacterales bacterium]
MRRWLVAMSLLAASAAPALAPYAALERPVPVGETDVLLQYDDGTGWWITWGGTYRGTWFDAEDFIPPGVGFWWAEDVELWFYHWVELYPWDTSSFYSELWNGGVGAPTTLLHQTSIQAMHCSPCCYSPEITLATQFWLVVNTEMSQGGWPSTLADNTPSALGDHS